MKLHVFNININEHLKYSTNLDGTRRWIKFGEDNLLPQHLVELYEQSPTHMGIIERKATLTSGNNIISTDLALQKFIEECNLGDGMHNLLHRCARDLHLYGGFCIQIIWYLNQRKIKDIIYQDFSEIRRGFENKINSVGLVPQGIWHSIQWQQPYKYKAEFYDLYNPKVATDSSIEIPKKPVFLYHYQIMPAKKWYPIPSYFGALKCIYNEIELINFMNSTITQGFNPSGILQVPDSLSPEEQLNFKKHVKKELSGTDNAGKIFAIFEDNEKAVKWTPFNDGANLLQSGVKDFNEINIQKIVSAHMLPSPTIIGLPGVGGLSSDGNTIKVASAEFFNQVILKSQNEIMNEIKKLVKLAGYNADMIIAQNIPSY